LREEKRKLKIRPIALGCHKDNFRAEEFYKKTQLYQNGVYGRE